MSETWAEEEMKGAKLPDGRYRKNLAEICERLAARTGVAFSVACGTRLRQSAHRLFEDTNTTMAGLLKGHIERTAERSRGFPLVLVAQDTTTLDYSTHKETAGLGPIGTKDQGKGLFLHTALAMTEGGRPLGVVHQTAWARSEEPATDRRDRTIEEKESRKWLEGLEGVETAFYGPRRNGRRRKPVSGRPRILMIQDREADVFAFLSAPREPLTDLLVRVGRTQRIAIPTINETLIKEREESPFPPFERDVPSIAVDTAESSESKEKEKLDNIARCARSAPRIGSVIVTVPRKPGEPARTARLGLQRIIVHVKPPKNGSSGRDAKRQRYNLIRAVELETLEGSEWKEALEGIEWLLYATLDPEEGESSEEYARRVVGYYSRRWGVERFHFTLKSGLRIERSQIDDAASLMNAAAVCSIVAWRLLSLTHRAREEPDLPAEREFTEVELTLLRHSSNRKAVNLRDAVRAVARLGGFEGTPSAGEPGVKALWQGLSRLDALVQGFLIARSSPPLTIQG